MLMNSAFPGKDKKRERPSMFNASFDTKTNVLIYSAIFVFLG